MKKGYKRPPYSKEWRNNMRKAQLGKKHTKEHKQNISKGLSNSKKVLRGDKHGFWKGDEVGYTAIHDWIKKLKGFAKDGICSMKDRTCKGILGWSNKSRQYKRDVKDWEILCKSHHTRYDRDSKRKSIKRRLMKQ